MIADYAFLLILLAFAWVGHACIWTTVLNYVYARPYPKPILKIWRHFTGLMILGFPILLILFGSIHAEAKWSTRELGDDYLLLCLCFGAVVFPVITVYRYFRRPPKVLLSESTHTIDYWKELGPSAIGNGRGRLSARMPFNDIYQMDYTDLVLAIPNLPMEWDGLTILHISDVHYHGTPSREFHERVCAEIAARWPNPDLVCLSGDFVDSDEHHTWIGPMLGRFLGAEGNFAILGNHDQLYEPDQVRTALTKAGYTVLGNGWKEATVRGIRCLFVGHEGPWFTPPPDLSAAPRGLFRFCLSHTPDNFYWGIENQIGLMLCGHVHGGQIRLPIIGSIFVPSMYGRRFDMGVFAKNRTAMVVSRGLSGREPLRFRCHPQVQRIKLKPAEKNENEAE